jgi:hypothetical protein
MRNEEQKAEGRKAAKTSAPLLPPAFSLSQSAFRIPKSEKPCPYILLYKREWGARVSYQPRARESRFSYVSALLNRPAACEQVDDQNNERNHE